MSYHFFNRTVAEALYQALEQDAFYQTMEAAVEENGYEAMLKYLDYSMVEGREFGELYLPISENLNAENSNDESYGASIWSKPLDKQTADAKSGQKKAFLLEHMGEKALQTYNSICDFMSEQSDRLVAEDAWYLSILGISPDFQGRGLGPGLIAPIIEQADNQGVSTFLETFTPRNMSFYQRLGYRDSGSFIEPATGAKYWVMIRPAQ